MSRNYFAEELERRRAALAARMPATAAIVVEFRRLFGPQVDCTGAIEGAERYRDPDAFAVAWAEAGLVGALFRDARRTLPAGSKSDGFISVPGGHERARRL